MGVEVKDLFMIFKKIYTSSVLSKVWTSELRYIIASFIIPYESLLARSRMRSNIVYISDILLNTRYEAKDYMSRYKHLIISMFSDTIFASKQRCKSSMSFTCSQVFTTDLGWISDATMKLEKEVNLVFKISCQGNGIT